MKILWTSFRFLLVMTVLTGVAYPLAMTVAGQVLFPRQANGSLIHQGDIISGSHLIAQKFTKPDYFWPRPSAVDFNPLPSGASNLGPTSAELKKKFVERTEALKAANPESGPAPQDLLFASGSGLDPHISVEAAHYQVPRIIRARGFTIEQEKTLDRLIDQMTEPRTFGILGERRINVVALNMALDAIAPK